jgi:hypothetical protein
LDCNEPFSEGRRHLIVLGAGPALFQSVRLQTLLERCIKEAITAPNIAPGGLGTGRDGRCSVATNVTGVRISELLPRCAKVMHRLALIRSLSHSNANHVQASLMAMSGHSHPPSEESRGDFPPAPTDFPPIGAVLSARRKPDTLPTWVQVGP